MRINVTGTAAITADRERRTLVGTLYRYDEVGQTSAGPLRVSAEFPLPPIGLPITLEHDRSVVRAHLSLIDNNDERLRISARVVDGPLGDQALDEAASRDRAAFSLDIEDAEVVDGVIVSGRWQAVGQVGNPAFNSARIDRIAASLTTTGRITMTDDERARLRELAALNTRDEAQEAEFQSLTAQAVAEATAEQAPPTDSSTTDSGTAPAAPVQAARVPAVPGGVPAPTSSSTTAQPRGGAFARFVSDVTAGLAERASTGSLASITAALADVTHSANTTNIDQPAWSGELWSGLVYEPEFSDLFTSDTLTSWEGKGWRFTSKLKMQDYAGDKAEIPTSVIGTESSSYEAARAAVGVDIDRKFFDFPNEGFVAALFEQARESWAILRDEKVRAYVLAKAKAAKVDENDALSAALAAQPTLLKAAAAAVRSLKRRKVGRASWLYVNDDDLFTLLDVAEKDVSAFLDLFGIDPGNFRSSEAIPAGTVLAGVKQSATYRELPGSPVRVEAQNLTRAGVDEAFFGYWAIEEHHTSGIAKVTFTPPA